MAHGEYNHIEIPVDDAERAQRFYSGVLGWEFRTMEGYEDYWLYRSGPGELGGGLGMRGRTAGDVLRNYVTVDSLDDALANVESLGGRIDVAKTEMPGMGWYAAVKDSEGNELGLYEFVREGSAGG
jgi:predicted enzyme related to lactoylglutathione lyase